MVWQQYLRKYRFLRDRAALTLVTCVLSLLSFAASAKACGEFVPFIGLGPALDRTTAWHFAGDVGAELNGHFTWFCGVRLIATTNPSLDGVFETGRYFDDGLLSLGIGGGYGIGRISGSSPVFGATFGLLGRGINTDLLFRTNGPARRFSIGVMIDIVHLGEWLNDCLMKGIGSALGPSQPCGDGSH